MFKVTVDIFSGRPNPEFLVGGDEAKELLQEIGRSQVAIGGLADGFQGLGYRGLVIEAQGDDFAEKHGLPAAFRIGHSGAGKGAEIVDRILGSMQKARAVDDQIRSYVRKELDRLEVRGDTSVPDKPTAERKTETQAEGEGATASAVCYIELGAFNPGFWNDPAVRPYNNCYNYASNRRTNTFAQPGRASGAETHDYYCPNVTNAALADGLHRRFDCFPDTESPRWLMALVIAPGWDYHWYRKQLEGFWGHKPGGTAARNTDQNGNIVCNPETAARGDYIHFCGYFYACRSQRIN